MNIFTLINYCLCENYIEKRKNKVKKELDHYLRKWESHYSKYCTYKLKKEKKLLNEILLKEREQSTFQPIGAAILIMIPTIIMPIIIPWVLTIYDIGQDKLNIVLNHHKLVQASTAQLLDFIDTFYKQIIAVIADIIIWKLLPILALLLIIILVPLWFFHSRRAGRILLIKRRIQIIDKIFNRRRQSKQQQRLATWHNVNLRDPLIIRQKGR